MTFPLADKGSEAQRVECFVRTEGSTGAAGPQACGVFIVVFLGSVAPCLFVMMLISSKLVTK